MSCFPHFATIPFHPGADSLGLHSVQKADEQFFFVCLFILVYLHIVKNEGSQVLDAT